MLTLNKFPLLKRSCLIVAAATLGWTAPVAAHVASIVIDSPAAPAFAGAPIGTAGPYVTLKGRVFGELDPRDHHNVIIQDLELAPKDDNRIPAQANCRLRRAGARVETLSGYGLSGIRLGLGADFDKPKSGGSGGMTWLGYQNVR